MRDAPAAVFRDVGRAELLVYDLYNLGVLGIGTGSCVNEIDRLLSAELAGGQRCLRYSDLGSQCFASPFSRELYVL